MEPEPYPRFTEACAHHRVGRRHRERAAGNTVASLELQVAPNGGDPYPVSLRSIIAGSDLGPHAPGSTYSVRIDPENRQNVTFG